MNELRTSEGLLMYQTTVLSFINALLISTIEYHDRRNIRNEFIGLGLLEIITSLR